ncbi:TetR family transcriptional regulator [Microbacterium sp. AG1240]|uniref:TetR/AcrR family transcriptional regulator n=1 Tax=Microbacterium sp. AG1240 TaxID=2183992 RepID=UPI000EAC5605|nr:TetR/AcrR family transcriptional regulator [Microbacterium sp. AG1240]RKT31240.1 TetR family transcriptional regulator [Microbacterium sp. AG1240]
MSRWAPDAALRLENAAVDLFEKQGYGPTTVPQIAARAGLTTRTFFRHFADKREVLFLRDREFPDVVGAALTGLPGDLGPSELVERALASAVEPLERWREAIGRRRTLIQTDDRLKERELLKSARLSEAVASALSTRGLAPLDARLLAAMAVSVFDVALDGWLDSADGTTLADHLAVVWDRMRAVHSA